MYQKCVCFLFLVILAVLSCSAFHIDNLAMADFSKKNFHFQKPHKIRHHRLWRTQARDRYPKSQIETFVYYPPPPKHTPSITPSTIDGEILERISSNTHSGSSEISTTFPNENLAQIPPTDYVVSRAQRSSDHRQRKPRWTLKQNEDIFAKAFKAKLVVLADVESKSINEANGACQFYAKVIKDFKGNAQKYFGSVNRYLRHIVTAACDLVKEMKISRKYVLLLNKKNDKLVLIDTPKPKKDLRASTRKKFNRVCKSGFVPTKPQIVELKEFSPKSQKKIEKKYRILTCTVKGFPLPRITWRRNNVILHHNKSYNVLYKRRKSKLVIKKHEADSLGEYECIAESLNGLMASKNITVKPPPPSENIFSAKSCPKPYDTDLCQNGGKCFYEESIGDYGCVCPDNFSGKNCQLKLPSNTRFQLMEPPRKNVEKKKRRWKQRP
ncbi:uncharacterized protein LOC130903908 isoform X1 [Diorhabda carinulata]|uniref:uncharacterized protein LOC130903908 isoform X1 n=1 Tax=Diorhabda carinulata TaxID=1163345 RepID=UPI0025A0831A|nr:uncharacterized protein LOC130903908 isoform X1 [Diorhabda carinulata]